MRKAGSKKTPDDLRAEYDFSGAIRGRHYKPLHEGYSVRVRRTDGTIEEKHYALAEGAVLLQPDVREYFPDSDAVNSALRSLVALMAKMPMAKMPRRAVGRKKRHNGKHSAPTPVQAKHVRA